MDARVFDKKQVPSRDVTDSPVRAPDQPCRLAAAGLAKAKVRQALVGLGATSKNAQRVGPAFDGAVTHSGINGETHFYADL